MLITLDDVLSTLEREAEYNTSSSWYRLFFVKISIERRLSDLEIHFIRNHMYKTLTSVGR